MFLRHFAGMEADGETPSYHVHSKVFLAYMRKSFLAILQYSCRFAYQDGPQYNAEYAKAVANVDEHLAKIKQRFKQRMGRTKSQAVKWINILKQYFAEHRAELLQPTGVRKMFMP